MKNKIVITPFIKNDIKIIVRDTFLLFMFIVIVCIGAFLKFGIPALHAYFSSHGILPNSSWNFSLLDLYPTLVALFVLFQISLLIGTLLGFVLIDEKDEKTIKALLVSPVTLQQYLAYKIGFATALSFFIIMFELIFLNATRMPLWQLCTIAFGASLTTPIVLLFFGIAAQNKIQGFAISKIVSTSALIILFGYFVPMPWQWLLSLFPPFLISKSYWLALEQNNLWIIALLIGIVLQIICILFFISLFKKTIYKGLQ